jgi:hypothetical protein
VDVAAREFAGRQPQAARRSPRGAAGWAPLAASGYSTVGSISGVDASEFE